MRGCWAPRSGRNRVGSLAAAPWPRRRARIRSGDRAAVHEDLDFLLHGDQRGVVVVGIGDAEDSTPAAMQRATLFYR